jgi:hypothetical protein
MSDWRKKIDDREKSLERERLRVEALAEAQKKRAFQEERARKIKLLSETFSCHICRKPATIPAHEIHTKMSGDYSTDSWYEDNWSKPGDLFECVNCHKLACQEHIYKDICQKCAEKL